MLRRWVYVVVGSIVALIALSLALGQIMPQEKRHSMPQAGPVVVIGIPGLKWSDISQQSEPGLWSLLQVAGTGSITPRATDNPTCTADAWLSLGAGRGADANCTMPPAIPSGANKAVPGWKGLADQNHGATPGLVASTFRDNKQCTTAVGRGAALAAATKEGKVARYFAAPSEQALQACPVTFVDLGSTTGGPPKSIDKALQPIFTHIKPDTTVLVTGISDGTESHTVPRALLTLGPSQQRGELTSESTRQPGFVSAPDLSAHVLARVKASERPDGLVGAPLTLRPDDAEPAEVAQDRRRTELKLTRAQDISMPYQIGVGVLTVLTLGVGAWRWQRNGTAPRWLAPAGVMIASLPVASWLTGVVPWWLGGPTTVWFLLALLVGLALVTSVAYAGPWREWSAGPPLVVAAITLAVLALDVIHGSRLQFIAPQGLQPLEGGRFFGMGNAGFGIFATAALLLGGLVAVRLVWWDDADALDFRLAAASVAVTGVAAAVIDGWPSWGADFGGPPTLLVSSAIAVALILGIRLSLKRVALLGAIAVAFVGLLALLDWRRDPQSRTHLGRFVEQVADGEALGLIGDKLGANIALLFSSPVAPLVPLLVIAGWLIVVKPQSRLGQPVAWLWDELPLLRWVCLAGLACWSIAFLLNDSGVGVPAAGAQLAVPLLFAIAAVARQEIDNPERADRH